MEIQPLHSASCDPPKRAIAQLPVARSASWPHAARGVVDLRTRADLCHVRRQGTTTSTLWTVSILKRAGEQQGPLRAVRASAPCPLGRSSLHLLPPRAQPRGLLPSKDARQASAASLHPAARLLASPCAPWPALCPFLSFPSHSPTGAGGCSLPEVSPFVATHFCRTCAAGWWEDGGRLNTTNLSFARYM